MCKWCQNKEAYKGLLKDKYCILFIWITRSSKFVHSKQKIAPFSDSTLIVYIHNSKFYANNQSICMDADRSSRKIMKLCAPPTPLHSPFFCHLFDAPFFSFFQLKWWPCLDPDDLHSAHPPHPDGGHWLPQLHPTLISTRSSGIFSLKLFRHFPYFPCSGPLWPLVTRQWTDQCLLHTSPWIWLWIWIGGPFSC